MSALARRFDLDRRTVRREVHYSARVLYQELRQHRRYGGSYDTVTRFVQPLRAGRLEAERALTRFETPPGQQSQIDWARHGSGSVTSRRRSTSSS